MREKLEMKGANHISRMVRRWAIFGMLAVSVGAGGIRAQEDPAELAAMRAQFKESLRESLLPVMRGYGRALRDQMTEMTKAGKLDEALAFKKEMEAVAAELLAMSEAKPDAAEPAVATRRNVIDFLEIIDTASGWETGRKMALGRGEIVLFAGRFCPESYFAL